MRQKNAIGKDRRRLQLRLATASIAAALISGSAFAADQANTSGQPTQNGAGNNAVTITLSGSTAFRNFTTSPGITLLTPGSQLTLGNGNAGEPIFYVAPSGGGTSVQLASRDFSTPDSVSSGSILYANTLGNASTASIQNHSAIRQEWHEQGSVEGIVELVNDEIGYAGGLGGTPITNLSTRNILQSTQPAGNPVWINGNKWDGTGTQNFVGNAPGQGNGVNPFHGFTLNNSTYNTYDNTVYNLSTGQNLQGGMNRVQMGISDVNHVQGFSIAGTGSVGATPQTAGYGKGNSTLGLTVMPNGLPSNALVTPGSSFSLLDQNLLNMPTTNLDPQTGANYNVGAWNTAGLGNLVSTRVAATATTFSANPGTGLTKLNSSDAQWLQSTGRLQNGADFNMSTRDVNSGTRNVAAVNTGVDPSFAVGKNDAGNGYVTTAGIDAQSQINIGGSTNGAGVPISGGLTAQLFSNKSTGGQLRGTVQNNRMGIGTLGMSDAISSSKDNTSTTPLRVLAYADTAGQGAGASYVLPSATTITDGTYVIYQNEQYVTVKTPDANYGATNVFKGDTAQHDLVTFRNNIFNAVANFPPSGVANPADSLLANSFILPQFMQVEKNVDGINQSAPNAGYGGDVLRGEFLGSSYAAKFNPADPSTVTTGSSAYYGAGGLNMTMANAEKIAITPQNYLFGNFNQNGVRDFSAVQTGLAAAKALYNNAATVDASHGTSLFTGDSNTTPVTATGTPGSLTGMLGQRGLGVDQAGGASKGDLIVMGDYNGDGKFNGADLYGMARGAALADAAGGTTLTSASGATFGDQVRNGVLVKNAALDYMQNNTGDATYDGSGNPTNASAFLRQTASRNTTNDPRGNNAFNRYDVNGDGVVNRTDAAIIDHFYGKSYMNMADQLSATINVDGTLAPGTQKPISLVDVQQIDGAPAIGAADLHDWLDHNPGLILAGDANFDGKVDIFDLNILLPNFNHSGTQWSTGDFNGDGKTDIFDLNLLLPNFNHASPADVATLETWAQTHVSAAEQAYIQSWAASAVPEPGTLGVVGIGLGAILLRRRRANA